MGGRGGSSHAGKTTAASNLSRLFGNIPNATVIEQVRGFPDGRSGVKEYAKAIVVKLKEGIEIVYKKDWNKSMQVTTPEEIAKAYRGLDKSFQPFVQKTIFGVDYENPADDYWRREYQNFTKSDATGGREITYYGVGHFRSDSRIRETMYHEAGHYIDGYLALDSGRYSERISDTLKWRSAMAADFAVSHRRSYTTYGQNAPAEDFAESMFGYFMHNTEFRRDFPSRAKVIDQVLKELKPYV